MTKKCPVCDYSFSDKEDFSRYSEPGETIQCPVCATELVVNMNGELEVVALESLDFGISVKEKTDKTDK